MIELTSNIVQKSINRTIVIACFSRSSFFPYSFSPTVSFEVCGSPTSSQGLPLIFSKSLTWNMLGNDEKITAKIIQFPKWERKWVRGRKNESLWMTSNESDDHESARGRELSLSQPVPVSPCRAFSPFNLSPFTSISPSLRFFLPLFSHQQKHT